MPRHGETKAKIIEILDRDPGATNIEIAEAIGLRRARVSQVRIELRRPQGRLKRQPTVTPKASPVYPFSIWWEGLKKIVRR